MGFCLSGGEFNINNEFDVLPNYEQIFIKCAVNDYIKTLEIEYHNTNNQSLKRDIEIYKKISRDLIFKEFGNREIII